MKKKIFVLELERHDLHTSPQHLRGERCFSLLEIHLLHLFLLGMGVAQKPKLVLQKVP